MLAAGEVAWRAVGENVVLASCVVVALGVLWRYVGRPVSAAVAIIQRELTHNGGSSVKDHTSQTRDELALLTDQMVEVKSAVRTHSVVLDRIVERKALDHDEMWSVLAAHGIDRRRAT